MPYARPLLDAVRLFETLGVGYTLIGGLASMVYGRSRFTEDVDFMVASDFEERVAAHPDVMRGFRFDPTHTRRLYHDSGIPVDVWHDEHADEIVARSRQIDIAAHPVNISEPHDLIAMKLRAGRPRDENDISEILVGGERILDATIQSRVTPEQFQQFTRIKSRVGLDRR